MFNIGDIVEVIKPSDEKLKKCNLAWVSPMMDEYIGGIYEIYHDTRRGGGRRQYKLVGAGSWWWDESWLAEPSEDTLSCGEFEELL